MPKIVSVIPPSIDGQRSTKVLGTKVLLDNGEYLQGVTKVTLIADPGEGVWKAIIEVTPVNQHQIDAVMSDIIVAGRDE
ncbi:hypothetical protein [Acinetobacter sp. 2JN-4]|uniref:hypothetical protein n=1 Tax=Acinetobacter sp. 2JN-4 TaxID=2479844 RepID=UPI00148B8287|nr:hypothetical protein [Acinetobacter sp. 2JN-4]